MSALVAAATPRVRLVLLAIAVVILGGIGLVENQRDRVQVIEVMASAPLVSVDELVERAEIIVLVVASDNGREHWNNASNTRWEAPESQTLEPMIVRDSNVQVIQQAKGRSVGDAVSIRMIGGRVGDIAYVFDPATKLMAGTVYVAFLHRVDWPTEGGSESVLTPVLQGQGIFELLDGTFQNSTGTKVDPPDVGF